MDVEPPPEPEFPFVEIIHAGIEEISRFPPGAVTVTRGGVTTAVDVVIIGG